MLREQAVWQIRFILFNLWDANKKKRLTKWRCREFDEKRQTWKFRFDVRRLTRPAPSDWGENHGRNLTELSWRLPTRVGISSALKTSNVKGCTQPHPRGWVLGRTHEAEYAYLQLPGTKLECLSSLDHRKRIPWRQCILYTLDIIISSYCPHWGMGPHMLDIPSVKFTDGWLISSCVFVCLFIYFFLLCAIQCSLSFVVKPFWVWEEMERSERHTRNVRYSAVKLCSPIHCFFFCRSISCFWVNWG